MQKGGHFEIFECPRRLFHCHEKSGHVLQKEGLWQPYLAVLLICDLCKFE